MDDDEENDQKHNKPKHTAKSLHHKKQPHKKTTSVKHSKMAERRHNKESKTKHHGTIKGESDKMLEEKIKYLDSMTHDVVERKEKVESNKLLNIVQGAYF